MATRRTRLEVGALIAVSIVLIVLLVLVSITFSKVNQPSTAPEKGSSISPPTRSTTAGTFDEYYDGTLNSDSPWDQKLCIKSSSAYAEASRNYEALITASLVSTYPDYDTTVTINGFNPSDGKCGKAVQRSKRSVGAVDETTEVDFTSKLTVPVGQSAPNATMVASTIDGHINCTCNVASLVETITTAEPTTEKHSRPPYTSSTTENTRRTPAEVAADYLRLNMDHTARPCDDFYKFSCGNFKKYHQKDVVGYGTFDVVQDRVIDEIDVALAKINLTQMPDAPEWLSKTKRFYDGCMKLRQEGDKHNRRLLQIIDSFGGWPMIMEPGKWNETKFVRDFPIILADLTAVYGVQTLITAGVDVDWKNPTNFIPQIDQATLGLGNPAYYSIKKFPKVRQDYVQMIRETAAVLTFDQDKPQDDVRVRIAAREILDFETMLSEIVRTDDQRKSYVDMYNPQVVGTIQEHYPFMNWQTYLDRLLPDNVQKPYDGLSNIVETKYLDSLNAMLSKMKRKEKLANYLIWRLIDSLSMFMDDSVTDIGRKLASRTKLASKSNGVTATIRSRGDCTSFLINELAFASTRLLFKDANEKDDYKNIDAVKNMTERLMDSFKNQLDTLFWMDDKTRNEAKKKLDNYVELSEAPAWIFTDTLLDKYYNDFKVFDLPGHFMDDYISLMTFHEDVQFRLISDSDVHKKDFPRSIWTLPPTLVNAWYNPEFNSITFPTAILRAPFFRYDFPWAVNFGSLGAVVGHEMTHGFDDQGIQFNGTGYLTNWMTAESKAGFDRMIDCVIRQYNDTCFPQVDRCIDGDQTQGENTADNGGIRAAYDSYMKYVAEYGIEDRLPGLENYTMEQIFFISFANVWCGDYETPEYLETQLVTNVHSPPPARVLNTLKNFADFGRAFECEVGQTYYPFRSDACYVWYSPPVSEKLTYNISAHRMLENMNHTVRPCENFYEYACGSFVDVHPPPPHASTYTSFDRLQAEIFDEIIDKLHKVESGTATAIQKAKTYFEVCRTANKTEKVNDTEILDTLKELGGWPAINQPFTKPKNINTFYSNLTGSLASMYGIQTFIVASSQVNPNNTDRNILVLDQSSLALGAREYYTEPKLDDVFANYTKLITNVIMLLANISDNPIKYQDAFGTASSISSFEKRLADVVRPDIDRRDYTKLFNVRTIGELNVNSPNLDVQAYLKALVQSNDRLQNHLSKDDTSVVISEPTFFKDLGTFVVTEYKLDNTILQNYLLWRFIYARLNFMSVDVVEEFAKFRKIKDGVTAFPPADTDCVNQLATMLGYTVGRLYVDNWKLREWRDDGAETVTNITTAFDETIPELDWMDIHSQEGARTKINQFVENSGFPDWILNNDTLDRYYENYTIDDGDTYFDAFNQLNAYAMAKAFDSILRTVDRKDFQMSPALVNAWYNPSLNSLTIPAAILNPPYYSPDFPTPLKYGAIGIIMGHEMTHAFDDSGIQFDGDGYLDLWMSNYSKDSYETNVVDCVVNQYSHYCHDINGEQFCVDGFRTQGENIADNGGIRQSFRAYRNLIRDKARKSGHEEELLPGMEWFTEDQIFFLGAAQFWCGYYSDKSVQRQLLTDVHSPGPDRVKGMVSNFAEFDKAFHCHVGEPMNPKDKCYVWTNPTDTTDGYDKSAKALLESIDTTTDPCNDFFQYACGNWISRHPIPKGGSDRSTNSETTNLALLRTSQGIMNVDEKDDSTPTALTKTKEMFDFCKDQINNDTSTSFDSFTQFVNKKLHGWPIMTAFWNENYTTVFEVVGTLGSLGVSPIFNAYPQPNYGNLDADGKVKNYALFIDQGQLLLGSRQIYVDPTFDDIIGIYRDVLIYTVLEMTKGMDDDKRPPLENIHDDVDDIINFEKALARISLPQSLQENYTIQYNTYKYESTNSSEPNILTTDFKNIDWEAYFKALLPKKLTDNQKSKRTNVILSEPSFVKALNKYIPFVGPRIVQNYLIWRYTVDSSPYLGDSMKTIHQEYMRKLGHLKRDNDIGDIKDDVSVCTQDAINFLPWTTGRLYAEQQFKDDISNITQKANETVQEVIDQFKERLNVLPWMDPSSKESALKKLKELRVNIGYPDWIFDNSQLDEFYESLTIDTSKDYFTTRQQIAKWFYEERFLVLDGKDVDRDYFQTSPAVQNAWYNPYLNSLTIPAAELQAPFFQLDYPTAVNFGGLGAIAGHELTHGFDNDGVQFNQYGGLSRPPWLDPTSAAYFKANISDCVVDQYDSYCYPDLPSGKLCINGKATQGENIADNGGTKTAFKAYVEWVRRHGYEALLPGLESFTMDQIFFLNFAQSWCGAITPKALEEQLLLDVHSPARNRVIGTLSNMVEFQAAFRCKKGDGMVPENRCDVW